MNTDFIHIMKRTISILVFGACFTFVGAANASAHTVDYRPGFVEVHYVHARARSFPSWLGRNRDFQRWYWHSSYRYKRYVSWNRLYHLYMIDRRHYRRGKVDHDHYYYDRDYRRYNGKRNRRRH